MDLASIGKSIAKFGLPLLGAALPIPGASMIFDALGKAIGSGSADPKDILATLQSSTEAAEKAKEFENQYKETILNSILKHQEVMAQHKADIITAESKGESWLQRNWRPLTMVAFVVLLFLYWFGVQPKNVTPDIIMQLFSLLKIGIGGYIGSRGIEKVVKSVPDIMDKLGTAKASKGDS